MTICNKQDTPLCPLYDAPTNPYVRAALDEIERTKRLGIRIEGISRDKSQKLGRQYRARLGQKHLGYYATEVDAYLARKQHLQSLSGVNVPDCPDFLK